MLGKTNLYTLSPHCVFDKEGDFPPYYTERCDNLFETVQSDEKQLHLLKRLLEEIFFAADRLVFDLVSEGEYLSIRAELEQFSDY